MTESEYNNSYDAKAKDIFSYKVIMARIVKNVVPEFADMELEEIQECFIVSGGAPQGKICTRDSVSKSTELKEIRFDLRFDLKHPKTNEICGVRFFLVDFEMQKKHSPGYNIYKRGVYYCARMLAEQLNVVSQQDSDYDSLKKVYSIWVITDAVQKLQGKVQTITLKDGLGETHPDFDLLSLNFIHLNLKNDYTGSDEFLKYLTAILKANPVELKRYLPESQYKIVKGDVESMSSILEVVAEERAQKIAEERAQKIAAEKTEKLALNIIRESRNSGVSDAVIYKILVSSDVNDSLAKRLLNVKEV